MPEEEQYVLIVDDDPNARALMIMLLRMRGIISREAPTGEDALKHMRSAPPSFVVLDIMMPGMSGFDVLRQIQLNPKTREVPILILTGARLQSADLIDMRGTVIGIVRKGEMDPEDVGRVIAETLEAGRNNGA